MTRHLSLPSNMCNLRLDTKQEIDKMTLTFRSTIIAALIVFFLSATAAMAKNISTTFNAPYEATVNAAIAAIRDLELKHKGTKASGGTTTVKFARPVTAFSWGEKGSIMVSAVNGSKTQVTVTSKKNLPLQITGKNTKTFSEQIFSAIRDHLQ